VNLDPANDSLPYASSVDISELITLSDVMDLLHLGPNGGLVYCMEYLERNIDWLQQRLQSSDLRDHYLLFDCPGQVELYTHNNSIRRVFARLSRDGYRLAAVHLADAHYCTEPSKFISVLLTSLIAMLQVMPFSCCSLEVSVVYSHTAQWSDCTNEYLFVQSDHCAV